VSAAAAAATLRTTPLRARHEALGARLVPFAGWEMPVQYAGVRAEHVAVRTDVGVFDVSHMGQIETRGPQAASFLQRMLSNDVGGIEVGGAQYSVLCHEGGGVLDDLFTYRLEGERYLTVTAGEFDVEVRDRHADFAMLAVQGPRARPLVSELAAGELPARMRTAPLAVAGAAALVCGTGYTGEDGVELLLAPADAITVWDALLAAGAAPVGLAARDTLRLEACFHLYGNDLSEERGPIEAGLGWCCVESTGFLGAEAVAAARAAGPAERLVPFALTSSGIARAGNAVLGGGEVTSGTLSPCLGVGIGLAYLSTARAEPGTAFEIDVRGTVRAAEVRTKPLYAKERPA